MTTFHEVGDGGVITYATWIRVLLVLVPVTCIAIALALSRVRPRWLGPILAAVVAIVSGVTVPGLFLRRVTLTPTRVEERTGSWWAPHVDGFDVDAVDYIVVRRKQVGDRRVIHWSLHGLDGLSREIDPGDLWAHNSDVVADYLEDRGVLVRFE